MRASHPCVLPSTHALASENTQAHVPRGRVFTHEETEALGRRTASPGSPRHRLGLRRGLQAHRHHLSPHSMAPYKDTATATPPPGFQPLPQSITCHPTVPIWTSTCTQTNVPVWGFENWVACREGAWGHRADPEGSQLHPTGSQAWDSGSHLEAKSSLSPCQEAHTGPQGAVDTQPSRLADPPAPSWTHRRRPPQAAPAPTAAPRGQLQDALRG